MRETDFGFIVMLNIFGCVLHLLNLILQSRVTQLLILRDLDLYEKRHKWDPSNGSGARFFVISLVVVGVLLLLCDLQGQVWDFCNFTDSSSSSSSYFVGPS